MTESKRPVSESEAIAALLMEGMEIDTIAELDKVYAKMVEDTARELQDPDANKCDRGEVVGSDSAA